MGKGRGVMSDQGRGEVARATGSELELPESYTEIPLGMSNFNHTIDDGFEEALKAGQVFGRHAGWEFNGRVWWDGTMFCEQVSRHHVHVQTYRAPSLCDLMAVVNDQWGWD